MGFDDATNTYKIVRVSGDQKSTICKLVSQIYVLGTSSWREIPSFPPCNLSDSRAFAYGNQHWLVCLPDPSLSSYGGVVSICSFNFRKEEFYGRIIPLPEHMHNKSVRCMGIPKHLHLLSLRGSLAIVDTSSDDYNIEIWVLKNYDKKEWNLDYKIDKSVLRGKMMMNLICCEWKHGIYFTHPRCHRSL
ncbi:hypothetical protein C1H46_026941 [Malus baccata]|uniref:F-box associated beta-propeller type 3 domain-containing protein n=1 Tax=Malus baccata TaxID=106549 RepID=A0A540LM22_MALBA|nr:hypothetical protein C1H46_026941 [Malus baccata]